MTDPAPDPTEQVEQLKDVVREIIDQGRTVHVKYLRTRVESVVGPLYPPAPEERPPPILPR